MKALSAVIILSSLGAMYLLNRRKLIYNKNVNVIIVNKKKFKRIKANLVSGGLDKLQLIADFDRTITTAFTKDGKRGISCHGILECCPGLSKEYQQKTNDLFQKYYPIEISHVLTREEKIPKMIDWYTKAHNLLLDEGFNESYIKQSVQSNTQRIELRKGCEQLFSNLQSLGIPILIFSAGIGNILSEVLHHKLECKLSDTTHIISNWMKFDSKRDLIGFSEPLIHMFNKDESHVQGSEYELQVVNRKNVILIGDSLGDVTMASNIDFDSDDSLLKIGFLNENSDNLLVKYKNVYDVILLNDASMEFLNDLIDDIILTSN